MEFESWGPHRGSLWTAGLWTAELRADEIADLKYDGSLVLRSIRAVVRDRDWRTVPVEVRSLKASDDGLTTTLDLLYNGFGISATAELVLHAEGDRFSVELSLAPMHAFDTNRTGLVLLHSPVVAGTPLTIGHTDGKIERTSFPDRISPHQPAFDIAELRWSSVGCDLAATFTGDTFEMEDQRNWTDASFKTYSRPLARTFPYRIEADADISQRVEVSASSTSGATRDQVEAGSTGQERVLRLVDGGRPVPAIGIMPAPVSAGRPSVSISAPADFMLVELDARDTAAHTRATLDRARDSSLPIDVRIVAEADADVDALVRDAATCTPVRLGVFSSVTHVTDPELWIALAAAAREHGIDAELVGGARSHFTEWNREHQRLPTFPACTISMTPQMHARDTFQLEESIGMQRRVAADASELASTAPLHIGPVTLRPRFNAVATTGGQRPASPVMDAETIDARQTSPQLAAWLVASAAALAEGGAASMTWFEEQGPRGIAADDGTRFPVYEAMAAVHALSGSDLLVPAVTSADDSRTWVLGARSADGVRLLIARLGDAATDVTIDVDGQLLDIHMEPGSWQSIDATTHARHDEKDI